MYKNIKVEAEHNELILENSHGDKVIIPANKRNWVKQKLSEGCHSCIDSLVETLPVASQYAGDGSVYPPGKKVKVNQDNQIKEYDINSSEYRDLYNSGRLMSYDKTSNTYIATPLEEVIITAEAPQWLKYKRKYESQYTKDWYIDNNMPKFSRSMGVSADNMHPNNVKEYDSYINDKVVEDIFKSKPTFDEDYSNDRLKTLQGFSQKELELIKNSKYASKIEPSIWSKFEQGLLSIGNMGSPVQFKSKGLSQEEAKKEDNPLNILQPLSIPSKMVQSAYKKDYSFKDALQGKQNNANIGEDIITDPLNLVGLGIWSKLSKANKFTKLDDAYQAVKGLSKEEQLSKLNEIADATTDVKNFKSEIDWGKWNKEIPENKALMQEYNAIEQQAKTDGTWMKNPDGSEFKGTPEQFIQQNSTNFKKAFGNSKLINPDGSIEPVVHSTNAKFNIFDKKFFGQTDEGYHGNGFYLSPIQRSGFEPKEFYKRPYKWLDNKTVQSTHNYGKNKMMLYANPDKIIGDFPVKPFTEIIVDLNKPFNIKSAIGNNGMFDMTNPNIYKSLIPLIGYANYLQSQQNNKKEQ